MIVGEKNLIIGCLDSCISDLSKSTFFYIKKYYNYLIRMFCSFLYKINPVSTAPPDSFRE